MSRPPLRPWVLTLGLLALALGGCRSTPLVDAADPGMAPAVSVDALPMLTRSARVAEIEAALRAPGGVTVADAPASPRDVWRVGGPGQAPAGGAPVWYGQQGHPTTTRGYSTRFLPIFGNKVRARGHDLPLPIGLSVGGFKTDREYKITKLEVAFDGRPIDTSFVTVEPHSRATAGEVKLDVWLFPFLQLYGFYGKIQTNTRTWLTIPDPRPGPGDRPDFTFEIPTDLDGDTMGGGIAIAGGYKGFFASLNANYSRTDLGGDSDILANLNSARIGYHRKFGKLEVSAWLGGVYWNVDKEVSGTVQVPDLGPIDFSVDYEPVEPFNMLAGLHVTYNEHFELVFEYGFWQDVDSVLLQAGVRL